MASQPPISVVTASSSLSNNLPAATESLLVTVQSVSSSQEATDQVDNHSIALKTSITTKIQPIPKITINEIPVKLKPQLIQAEEANKKIISFYNSTQPSVYTTRPYSINISHYVNSNLLYAQLNDEFAEFDSHFDEFQASCESSSDKLTLAGIKAVEKLETLAIAARFYDDSNWYRARLVLNEELMSILRETNPKNEQKILVEFVDYGNSQLTVLTDCVFLSEKFAKLSPCAVKCDGVAYLDTILNLNDIKNSAVENLLFYGRMDSKADDAPAEYKSTYESAYFISKFLGNFTILFSNSFSILHGFRKI